jgi:hypothetical protein
VTGIQVSGEVAPTDNKIDLGSLFEAALKTMTQNRQAINRINTMVTLATT